MKRSTLNRESAFQRVARASRGPRGWLGRSLLVAGLIAAASPAVGQRGGEGEPPPRDRPEAPEAESRSQEARPGLRLIPDRDRWPRPDQRIVLGVYAQPARVGYLVEGVVPGTPAQRLGMEPGDRIVAVDSYQVGRVGGRLYPLSEELQRRAHDDQHVVLLVQNVRDRQLLNLDVDFARSRFPGPIFGPRLRERADDLRGRSESAEPRSSEEGDDGDIIGRKRDELH